MSNEEVDPQIQEGADALPKVFVPPPRQAAEWQVLHTEPVACLRAAVEVSVTTSGFPRVSMTLKAVSAEGRVIGTHVRPELARGDDGEVTLCVDIDAASEELAASWREAMRAAAGWLEKRGAEFKARKKEREVKQRGGGRHMGPPKPRETGKTARTREKKGGSSKADRAEQDRQLRNKMRGK